MNQSEQRKRFEQAANELECDDSDDALVEAVGRLTLERSEPEGDPTEKPKE